MRLFVPFLCAAALQAGVIKIYDPSGGLPGAQGFSSDGGVLSAQVVTDEGLPALRMTGNTCCGYFVSALTPQQLADANTLGWTLTGTARVNASGGYGYIDLFTPSRRFDMVFGSNGTSSWAGLSMFTDAGNPALQVALTGTGYFNFEMRYDPGTQRASLFVNGNQALTGYAGHTQFLSNGVAFGVTGSTPQAYFQNVQFSINDPQTGVPEPGTLVLAGLGCVATGIRYQRGRKSA